MLPSAALAKSYGSAYNPAPFKGTGRRKAAESVQNATGRTGRMGGEMPKKNQVSRRKRFRSPRPEDQARPTRSATDDQAFEQQIRNLRGTRVMSDTETQRIKRWMPYHAG